MVGIVTNIRAKTQIQLLFNYIYNTFSFSVVSF